MAQRETQPQVDRRIPRWAAMLLARLAQMAERHHRDDVAGYLEEIDSTKGSRSDPERLGPPRLAQRFTTERRVDTISRRARTRSSIPYVDLRAWAASDPSATFALAGEAAAWHLGYIDRRFTDPIAVWLPEGERPPFGTRPRVGHPARMASGDANSDRSKPIHAPQARARPHEWATVCPGSVRPHSSSSSVHDQRPSRLGPILLYTSGNWLTIARLSSW